MTPLKPSLAKQFLKTLVNMENEIISNKSQLKIAINKNKNHQIFEILVRSLLDLDGVEIKTKFIEILNMLTDYSFIFKMALTERLNKEYYSFNKTQPLTENHFNYLKSISSLLSKICI